MKNVRDLLIATMILMVSCSPTGGFPEIATPSAPETPRISVLDYVTNDDYKKDCPAGQVSTTRPQVGYLQIYPGKTSAAGVVQLLGEPAKVIQDGLETNWLYDNHPRNLVSIIIVNDVVDRIGIDNYDLTSPSLGEIMEQYGCPSLIFITDRSEDSAGNYEVTTLAYPEIGIEYWFEGIKITMDSVPNDIRYIKPVSLRDYVESYKAVVFMNSPMSKPVYWHDVVAQ